MFERIQATTEANRVARIAEEQRRKTDPLERAKLVLRRHRFNVYDNRVHDPESSLIVVGSRRMIPDDVIAMAQRYEPQQENPPT